MSSKCFCFLLMAAVLSGTLQKSAAAAPKTHVVTLGKTSSVAWYTGTKDAKPLTMKIHPVLVDGRQKEYATGPSHDITERLFVIRRAFRVNDSLPDESGTPRWLWQRGGWLLVDRVSGHVSPVNLPDFDPFYSPISWYREYAAYCGTSEDGKKVYAVVFQLGRRKPLLKKVLAADFNLDDSVPDSACDTPVWQRSPSRVAFGLEGKIAETFSIHGQLVDLVSNDDDDSDQAEK